MTVTSLPQLPNGNQQLADYAMIFDMLGLLTGITEEDAAIHKIMELFTMLFAPGKLVYLSIRGKKIQAVKSNPSALGIDENQMDQLKTFPDNSHWAELKNGFKMAIQHSGQTLGIVAIDELGFPERKRHYLNLALAMTPVLALIVTNARNFQEKENLILKLQEALAKVQTLSGLLPICASCKKIRDDHGYWNQLESYIGKHADVQFSHGICPDCAKKLYPDLFQEEGAEEAIFSK